MASIIVPWLNGSYLNSTVDVEISRKAKYLYNEVKKFT
jgi:hypothetical protein